MPSEQFYTDGSWTCPNNVTSIMIECYGGGGGGDVFAGAGGGGGAYSKKNTYAVTPGASYSYTVGAGGSPGNSGGTTDFDAVCTAMGGDYGALGGFGGQASLGTGDVKYDGGKGAAGGANDGGGGGGCAGTGGAGGDGSGTTGGTGNGGYAGNGGKGDTYPNLDGTAGYAYGGGGGGAESDSGVAYNGSNGMIQITYEFNPRKRGWEGGAAHNSGGGISF